MARFRKKQYLCAGFQKLITMNKNAPEVIQLRKDVEARLGMRPATPADFETLIAQVWLHLHENIALSTLERLWGYIEGANNTRRSTLNILSRYVGSHDWDDYNARLLEEEHSSSNPFIADGIHTEDLQLGQKLEVTWLPNRRCVFRYLGDMHFEVLESSNSKLSAGDSFVATFFLIGQPLYIDHLVLTGHNTVSYVAGNNGGLQSVTLL